MAQGAIDVNRMIGRLLIVDGRNDLESEEYFDMVNAIFRVWKAKEYLNEEGDIEELFCDYTNDELSSEICISEGKEMSIIDGPVKFKEPEFNPDKVSVTATDERSIFPVFETVMV